MAFQVDQKVKVKPGSASERVTGAGVLTVIRLANEGQTVCVAGEQSGARWVNANELEVVDSESTGT